MSTPKNEVTTLLDAVGTTGAGAVYGGQTARVFAVEITDTATVQMQCSVDNVLWLPLGDPITATAGYESEAPWPYMRANVTSWTSGTVTVKVAD